MTNVDAARMKRNMALAVRAYRLSGFSYFQVQAVAVLEHHFGDHSLCDPSWCPYHRYLNNPKKLAQLKYRNKKDHLPLYIQMKELHDKYVSDEWLPQIWHMWNTNKNENVNKLITKFVPKTTYLCQTIVAKLRIYVAIGIDSIGQEEYYKRLYKKLGIQYDDTIAKYQHMAMDYQQKYRETYKKNPQVMWRTAMLRALNMRKEIDATYESV